MGEKLIEKVAAVVDGLYNVHVVTSRTLKCKNYHVRVRTLWSQGYVEITVRAAAEGSRIFRIETKKLDAIRRIVGKRLANAGVAYAVA